MSRFFYRHSLFTFTIATTTRLARSTIRTVTGMITIFTYTHKKYLYKVRQSVAAIIFRLFPYWNMIAWTHVKQTV